MVRVHFERYDVERFFGRIEVNSRIFKFEKRHHIYVLKKRKEKREA